MVGCEVWVVQDGGFFFDYIPMAGEDATVVWVSEAFLRHYSSSFYFVEKECGLLGQVEGPPQHSMKSQ